MWGSGVVERAINPDMPWNEEIRAAWAREERLAGSPRTVELMLPLITEGSARAILPTVRVPTLVVQHSDDVIIPPSKGRYIAEQILDAKYVELPGRNMYHFGEPWRESFQEISGPSFETLRCRHICDTAPAGERRFSGSGQCTRSTSGSLQVLSKKDFSGP